MYLWRQPHAIVGHFYLQAFIYNAQLQATDTCLGMADNIGQSLLHNTISRYFDGGRQGWKIIRLLNGDLQSCSPALIGAV